jgi:hypothetical protein
MMLIAADAIFYIECYCIFTSRSYFRNFAAASRHCQFRFGCQKCKSAYNDVSQWSYTHSTSGIANAPELCKLHVEIFRGYYPWNPHNREEAVVSRTHSHGEPEARSAGPEVLRRRRFVPPAARFQLPEIWSYITVAINRCRHLATELQQQS